MEFYYIDQNNQTIGPVSQEEISQLYYSGGIQGQTLVAPVGSEEWQAFHQLFQIQGAVPPTAPPARVAPGPHPGQHRQPPYAHHLQHPQMGYAQQGGYPMGGGPVRAGMPANTVGVFASSAPWAYVTSIYWWISAFSLLAMLGLLLIIGLAALKSLPSVFILSGLVGFLILGAMVAFCFVSGIQSWKLASNLSRLRMMPSLDQLHYAVRAQSSYFRTFSIFVILVFSGVALLAMTIFG